MRSWTRGEARRTGRSGNAPVHLTRPYEDRHGAGEQATMGLGDYGARPGRSPRTGKKARTDGSVNSRFGQNKTFRMVWAPRHQRFAAPCHATWTARSRRSSASPHTEAEASQRHTSRPHRQPTGTGEVSTVVACPFGIQLVNSGRHLLDGGSVLERQSKHSVCGKVRRHDRSARGERLDDYAAKRFTTRRMN